MADAPDSPDLIMRYISGHQASALVATATAYKLFTHLAQGVDTADKLAAAAQISPRGAQALLDGIVGLGLITVSAGRYANTTPAATFLVEGSPASLTGFAGLPLGEMVTWSRLPEAVATGAPVTPRTLEAPDLEFWRVLVPAIAPLAFPAAQATIAALDVPGLGPASILDVGGGSGAFAALLLKANPAATATQVDWPTVNSIAREYVVRFGVADRFHTVDGDFHLVDWGTAAHDIAIYSNIAHQESPEQNVEAFRRFRAALKPGGTLVVSDFILEDDRSGPPFALLFHGEMLLNSRGGAVWRQADYRAWLAAAGFSDVRFQATQGPSVLIFAR